MYFITEPKSRKEDFFNYEYEYNEIKKAISIDVGHFWGNARAEQMGKTMYIPLIELRHNVW